MIVYLAGPISGETWTRATDWRDEVAVLLNPYRVEVLTPLRGKEFLEGVESLPHEYQHPLSTQAGIVCRDRWDVDRADLVIANLRAAQIVSIGTCFELAWCLDRRKPTILVMEPEGNPNEHPFVRAACPYRVETIDAAVHLAVSILHLEKA